MYNTKVIEDTEYSVYESKDCGRFYVNFGTDADSKDGTYAIMLRFKKVQHLTWGWVSPSRLFENINSVIEYLKENTTNKDTMYKIDMCSVV